MGGTKEAAPQCLSRESRGTRRHMDAEGWSGQCVRAMVYGLREVKDEEGGGKGKLEQARSVESMIRDQIKKMRAIRRLMFV